MDSIDSCDGSSYVSSSHTSSVVSLTDQQARLREVDQRLSCPVCLERFSDPRLLDCNHTFCKKCLMDVLTKTPKPLDQPIAYEPSHLHCPKCRKVTYLDENGINSLPSNYALKDIMDVLPIDDTSSFSPSTPVGPYHSFPGAAPHCEEHKRILEFFCKTDDRLLCAECLVMPEHRGHDTVAARQILEEELETLRQNSFEDAERMLLKVREAVDSVSNMAHALREKGETAKSRIQRHFQEIRDVLESREQHLLQTTDDIIMKKVSRLEQQKKGLVKCKEDLETKVLKLKHILAKKDDYSFLRYKQKLVSDVSLSIEQAQSKDRTPLESTKDGPDYSLPEHLLSSAHTFGDVYCKPCPSKFTARGEGLSKAFVNKPAIFNIEARDRYGQRSVVSGTSVKVMIRGPDHSNATAQVQEVSKGEYQVTYTPQLVGYHVIRILADGVKIINGDSHVVVFNRRDYFLLGLPQRRIPKLNLRTDPPVSTMKSVCSLPSGSIVFTDAFCLRVVDPVTGELQRTIGSYGAASGQFKLPLGLAVNRQGVIFVTDTTNHRIHKFTADGRCVSTFGSHGNKPGTLSFPEGLALLGEDRLYVADCGNDRIQYFSQKNGKHQGVFGKKGAGPGCFVAPKYLAVDAKNGRVLVSDTGNRRIQALTLDGRPLQEFGNPKGGSVYLSCPYSITVDDDGFILVTETKSHYVTVLTPRGALVRHLGNQGDGPGQFRTPYGICVNLNKSQVVVTDSTSHCIQIF